LDVYDYDFSKKQAGFHSSARRKAKMKGKANLPGIICSSAITSLMSLEGNVIHVWTDRFCSRVLATAKENGSPTGGFLLLKITT
jgi:hypothetical protein